MIDESVHTEWRTATRKEEETKQAIEAKGSKAGHRVTESPETRTGHRSEGHQTKENESKGQMIKEHLSGARQTQGRVTTEYLSKVLGTIEHLTEEHQSKDH